MNATLLPTLIVGLFAATWAAPTGAFSTWRPDVLILVAASAGGQDQIGVTYAGQVPSAQAHRDLAALRAVTGWTLRQVHISDGPVSTGRKMQMTEADCLAAHVVRPDTHGLDVQPFIQAFRPYAHIVLTFFVEDEFVFQGLHDYTDKNMVISLDRHGGAYTYRIWIRNPRFERLSLPHLQPVTPDGGTGVIFAHSARKRKRLCQEHL